MEQGQVGLPLRLFSGINLVHFGKLHAWSDGVLYCLDTLLSSFLFTWHADKIQNLT